MFYSTTWKYLDIVTFNLLGILCIARVCFSVLELIYSLLLGLLGLYIYPDHQFGLYNINYII
jgi:hypothetical protein